MRKQELHRVFKIIITSDNREILSDSRSASSQRIEIVSKKNKSVLYTPVKVKTLEVPNCKNFFCSLHLSCLSFF